MEDSPQLTDESADAVFKHWELLRILYNAILAVVLIPWLGIFVSSSTFAVHVLEGAVAANIAFCAGHVAEGYLSMIITPRKDARYVLFILGTLLSIFLELAHIVGYLN